MGFNHPMNHLDTHCSGGIKLMNERNMNGYMELKGYISLKNKALPAET